MDAFSPTPPTWTDTATHALTFCCPVCKQLPSTAVRVWMNRYAPVLSETYHRKWQEFYQCQCTEVWWAWSTDRPPSPLVKSETPESSTILIEPLQQFDDDDFSDELMSL